MSSSSCGFGGVGFVTVIVGVGIVEEGDLKLDADV
jgi:hypothetical protein